MCLSVQEAEKHLSDMVVSKALVAKIDRPMGIVCFQTAKDSNDILNSWVANLEKLLDLVEKSCHQIHKENHGAQSCFEGLTESLGNSV
ncbi:26S proteasome non-ATPase regulatory subunit 12 A [Stylosanthes scabra]|uniref:26S proteasome non-ATPase regulatory subunit 12 A n=1 Tax=Stylosanthes scabra TaxID=79078 RepID=A0ABU6XGY3_9FABA|nr:26S proteasome non-ATPase regulatory subunit 12 A [Stylosanthes scabra]